MQIQLTGNPFVDTGLYVLTYLAKIGSAEQLTLDAIQAVHGDGTKLARINARLKSFTMVFGSNGPLTQSQYRPKGRQKELSKMNIDTYTGVLAAFLNEMRNDSRTFPLCEICGTEHGFNFDGVVRRALISAGATDRGIKQVGREWFPLAGSTGNDAQALPSGSRGLCVCAKCLFAVHYMPQGMMLMDRKLVCFQSNFPRIALELTADLTAEYVEMLKAQPNKQGGGKVETKGKGDKTKAMVAHLLSWMEKRQTVMDEEDLPDSVSLTVWLFNNGKGTDCKIIQIPNHTLQFLWHARHEGYKNELLSLLATETKAPERQQLFSCVQDERDYSRLYPFKSFGGASAGLFALYHQLVLGETPSALQSAQRLAQARLANAKAKEEKTLKKAGAFDADKKQRGPTRKLMLDMTQSGEFAPSDYNFLFPTIQWHPIRADLRGWKTIGYYISNPNVKIPDYSDLTTQGERSMKPHPKIKQLAKLYFEDYRERRGIGKFKKNILDNFQYVYPNGVAWLRDAFIRFAQDHPDFTNLTWDDFVLDENGYPQASELLFQMRLELANLYREYMESQPK